MARVQAKILSFLFFFILMIYSIKNIQNESIVFSQHKPAPFTYLPVQIRKEVEPINFKLVESNRKVSDLVTQNKIKNDTIITISNYGFANLTLNWISHLEKLNLNKFVVFCFDTLIFDLLEKNGYETRIAMIPGEWLDFNVSTNYSSWDSLHYNHIVQAKTHVWYHLAKMGHNIVYSDPDVVWLNVNILDHLEFLFLHSYADALFSQDQEYRSFYYNTGFFSLKSTKFTIDFLMKTIKNQRQNSDYAMEQIVFNDILKSNKFNDSRLVGLDPILFACGRVYFHLGLNKKWNVAPYIVHANYMIGLEVKINAFKAHNLWLI